MTLLFKRHVIAWTIFLLFAPVCLGVADTEKSLSQTLTGFDYLMNLAQSCGKSFDPDQIIGILDYVSEGTSDKTPVCNGGLDRSPMDYYGMDVNTNLDQIIRYCFNPDIQSCAVIPSMIRLSFWRSVDGDDAPLPCLWKRLKGLTDPLVVHGVYYMQNTPDPSTGAYYGYDSYRTLILMKYKGRNALISVLKQKDVSEVGKKGYVFEDGGHKDFFYSGERGLNKLGLGWVKSYLYDSFSIAVYMEHPERTSGIRYGVFKWINAGWAGKNMVRKKHVHEGIVNYATAFKAMMESKVLPPDDVLAGICHTVKQIPQDALKMKMEGHLETLQAKYSSRGRCPKMLGKSFDSKSYIDQMSSLEMRAALIVDAIRHLPAKDNKTGSVAYRPQSEDPTVF